MLYNGERSGVHEACEGVVYEKEVKGSCLTCRWRGSVIDVENDVCRSVVRKAGGSLNGREVEGKVGGRMLYER